MREQLIEKYEFIHLIKLDKWRKAFFHQKGLEIHYPRDVIK